MTELPKWATELKWDGFDFLPLGEIPNHEFVRAIYRAACIEIQKLRGEQLRPVDECERKPDRKGDGRCTFPDCGCGAPMGLTTHLPGVKTDSET